MNFTFLCNLVCADLNGNNKKHLNDLSGGRECGDTGVRNPSDTAGGVSSEGGFTATIPDVLQ